jgi:hypothetical protein
MATGVIRFIGKTPHLRVLLVLVLGVPPHSVCVVGVCGVGAPLMLHLCLPSCIVGSRRRGGRACAKPCPLLVTWFGRRRTGHSRLVSVHRLRVDTGLGVGR